MAASVAGYSRFLSFRCHSDRLDKTLCTVCDTGLSPCQKKQDTDCTENLNSFFN